MQISLLQPFLFGLLWTLLPIFTASTLPIQQTTSISSIPFILPNSSIYLTLTRTRLALTFSIVECPQARFLVQQKIFSVAIEKHETFWRYVLFIPLTIAKARVHRIVYFYIEGAHRFNSGQLWGLLE